MIALGEPATGKAATEDRADNADIVASAAEAPLDYPFPGGKAPVVRADSKHTCESALNCPAPLTITEGGNDAAAPSTDDARFIQLSPSIIALATPAVSFEQVAAVDKGSSDDEDGDAARRNLFGPGPTVIRGGIVGDSAPAQTFAPSTPAKETAVAHTQDQPSPSQQPGEPDYTPPPPPSGLVPRTKVQ